MSNQSVLSDEQLVATCYEAIRSAGSTPAENENDMLRLIAEQDPVALAVAAGLRAVAEAAIAADRSARAEPVACEECGGTGDVSGEYPGVNCPTCNGHGLIGGFVSADSGYDSLPCPDCNPPAAPVVTTEEGRHCGDPDCVPCRDPAEPAAPVVPEGMVLVEIAALKPLMPVCLDFYDAGILSDFGGGNVEWWQDYIRAELARAHDFYQSQIGTQAVPGLIAPEDAPEPCDNEDMQNAYADGWNNCRGAMLAAAPAPSQEPKP